MLYKYMLFIHPIWERYGGELSEYIPVGVPVAIGYLSQYLIQHGHKVKVHDEEIEILDEEKIKEVVVDLPKPYVFGISVMTASAGRSYELIKMIKKLFPDSIVLLGGIHPTALPEEGLENGADYVFRGESEKPLLNFYDKLRSSQSVKNVSNISYIDDDGKIIHNPESDLMRNLDEIDAFPYHLFDYKNKRYRSWYITRSRGCPYRCNFCSQRLITGKTVRYHSTERIIKLIKTLVTDIGVEHILFTDDIFTIIGTRFKNDLFELCDRIIEEGLHKKVSFYVQTRADAVNEEILLKLKAANIIYIGFGLETGTDRLHKISDKDATIETYVKSINLCKKIGLEPSVFMIYGFPTETKQDRIEGEQLIKKLGLHFTKFNNMIPYPGTKLYEDVKNSPQINIQKHWSNFNSTLTITRSIFDTTPLPFVPDTTTEWQLKREITKSNFKFYLHPRLIWAMFAFKKGPNFVLLPKYWFLKPKEIYKISKSGFIFITNYIITLLPEKIGELIYILVTGNKDINKPRIQIQESIPTPIHTEMKTIRLEKKETSI